MSSIIHCRKAATHLSACFKLSRSDRLARHFRRQRAADRVVGSVARHRSQSAEAGRPKPRGAFSRVGFASRPHYPRPDAANDACGAAIGRARACCHHDGGPEYPGRGVHDGHHRGRDRAFAGSNRAGDHRAGAGRATDIAVRRRERRANHRRSARFWRDRGLQYPDPHQWPQGERHRYAGRGSLHDSARFDRSASKSPKATAARCSMATMPWAASSTSSPRPG